MNLIDIALPFARIDPHLSSLFGVTDASAMIGVPE
jgi:hypothetical protein